MSGGSKPEEQPKTKPTAEEIAKNFIALRDLIGQEKVLSDTINIAVKANEQITSLVKNDYREAQRNIKSYEKIIENQFKQLTPQEIASMRKNLIHAEIFLNENNQFVLPEPPVLSTKAKNQILPESVPPSQQQNDSTQPQITEERKKQLDSLIQQINHGLPFYQADHEREKIIATQLMNQVCTGQINQNMLAEAKKIYNNIKSFGVHINARLDALQLNNAESEYIKNQTKKEFFDNNNQLIIPKSPYDHATQDLITTASVTLSQQTTPPTPWQSSIPNQNKIYEAIAKSVKNNPSLPEDLRNSTSITRSPTLGKLTAKSQDNKIDFEMNITRDSDKISGNTNKENLQAMSSALVANIQEKLRTNPNAQLSIDLNDCSSPEVAQKFKKCIDAEIQRMSGVLKNGNEQDKLLAQKLDTLKNSIVMPEPTSTARANISSSPPTSTPVIPPKTPPTQSSTSFNI